MTPYVLVQNPQIERPVRLLLSLELCKLRGAVGCCGDKTLKVSNLENYDFSDTDICLTSAGGTISQKWSPKIGRKTRSCGANSWQSLWQTPGPELPPMR